MRDLMLRDVRWGLLIVIGAALYGAGVATGGLAIRSEAHRMVSTGLDSVRAIVARRGMVPEAVRAVDSLRAEIRSVRGQVEHLEALIVTGGGS